MMHGRGKSDPAVVAAKPANKTGQPVAESVERRAGAEGNVDQQSTPRTQIRKRVTKALDRVRQAARQRKKERFTALLHHVNIDSLKMAFYALKRRAAPGATSSHLRHRGQGPSGGYLAITRRPRALALRQLGGCQTRVARRSQLPGP